jgi:RimJ/RimL family protein N-acetyltransferase
MRFAGDSLCPPIREELAGAQSSTIYLRRPETYDLDLLAAVFSSEEVWRYPYGRGLTRDETAAFIDGQIAHWERYGFGVWVLEERPGDWPIGYTGLSVPTFLPEVLPAVQIGWRLMPGSWGQGHATWAGSVALREAFERLGLDRVLSPQQRDNPASCRVAERIGMTATRTTEAPATDRRWPVEVIVYEITAEDWRSKKQ